MLRTPLFYQVERNSSSVRIMDNGSRVIAEGMTPQEAREATKRCNVHLELVQALEDAKVALANSKPVMEHYIEPNQRHMAAKKAVDAALEAAGKP